MGKFCASLALLVAVAGCSGDDPASGRATTDAGQGYDAKSIPGLVLWLDSEKGVSLAPASARWDDLSGNGNHAVKHASCGLPDRNAPVQKGHVSLGFHEYECLTIADSASLEWGIDRLELRPGPTLVYNDWSDRSKKIVGSVDFSQMLRAP